MINRPFAYLMQANRPVVLAAMVSGALIVAALLFEYIGGLVPCKLCLTQRLPHYGLIILGIASVIRPQHQILWRPLGSLCAFATAAVGLQHVGVERKWWQGPQGCSSTIDMNASLADLTQSLLDTPVVRCDEVAWSFLSVSMAGWNMVISLSVAVFLAIASWQISKRV